MEKRWCNTSNESKQVMQHWENSHSTLSNRIHLMNWTFITYRAHISLDDNVEGENKNEKSSKII